MELDKDRKGYYSCNGEREGRLRVHACVCGARSLKDCSEAMWQYIKTKFTIEPRERIWLL